MGQPVVHFEITAKDGEKLQSYYSDLFGWEIDANNEMKYGTISREGNTNSDGVGIGGGIATGPEGYEGHVTFYVGVGDPQAALEDITRLGGKTIQPPIEVPGGVTFALFADPEGHVVGLVKE